VLSDSGVSILIINSGVFVEVDVRPNVKRVVVTSSVMSLLESKGVPSYTFTEVDNVDVMPILALIFLRQNDWNLESEQIVERESKKTPGLCRYRAGKKKAEQAAWEFVNENKDLHFDLTTILPSVVFGASEVSQESHPIGAKTHFLT